jgi:hypothetical protein
LESSKIHTDRLPGGQKQKGIINWGLSANRQNPFAGAFHDAIFNTFRRSKGQVFYWVPPLVAAYYLMDWATERYVHNARLSLFNIRALADWV